MRSGAADGVLAADKTMNTPNHFEIMEGCAVFRPTGESSLEQAMKLIASAVADARERQIKKLMVVIITGLSGFGSPSVADRYFIIRDLARAAEGKVCVAMVLRPGWVDPEHIGATFAANAGMCGRSFVSEDDAHTWLKRC